MLKNIAFTVALILVATNSLADNRIGVIYVPKAELELDSAELDGSGFGVYSQFDISETTFVAIEYSATEQDAENGFRSLDVEIDQLRIGVGGLIPLSTPRLSVALQADVVSLDFEFILNDFGSRSSRSTSETGFGIHTGLNFAATEQFSLYGTIGYLSVDELDGLEYKVGLVAIQNEQFSLFADYRGSRLKSGDDNDVDISDLRVGAAFHF